MGGSDGDSQLLPSPENDLWHWVVAGCPVTPVQSCYCVILSQPSTCPSLTSVLPTGKRCYLVTLDLCWMSCEGEGARWIWLIGQVKEQLIMISVKTSPTSLPHSRQRRRISMATP